MSKTYTQTFVTDMHEAAVAKYAGYAVRWLANEQQWVIQNPGDLDELLSDVRSGVQTISNAIAFLKVYDELRKIKFGEPKSPVVTTPHGTKQELVKVKIETVSGKTWITKDVPSAAILSLRGNELLDIDVASPGKAQFIFAYDDNLNAVIAQFNKKELLVEPHEFDRVGYDLRDRLKRARGH